MFLLKSLTCRRNFKFSFDSYSVFLSKRTCATATKDEQLPKEHEGTASSVSSETKPTKPPFVKNIFAGIYDQDMLLYPEISNDRLFDLNSRVAKIEQFFKENGKSTPSNYFRID